MQRILDRIAPWLTIAIAIVIVGVIAAHVSAAEPKQPAPVVEPDTTLIEFPNVQPTPEPKPLPPPVTDPDAVPVLPVGELYVVVQKVPFRLIAVPPGLVNVTPVDGPVKVNGVFYGSGGKRETRNYNGHVAIVEVAESVKSGTVYLSLSVNGKVKPDGLEQRIDIGQGPRPPPDPVDPVDPVVTAKKLGFVNIDVAKDRVRNLPLARLLTDIAYWDTLRTAGHKVWLMDSSNAQARQYDAIAGTVGYPLTVIYDATVTPPKQIGAVRTPNTKAEYETLRKTYEGK